MDTLTIPTSLLSLSSSKPLAPAMVAALWVIADELDQRRIPAKVKDAVWLEIPSARLRGNGARNDNIWLRECLRRLTGLVIQGEYRGDPWGAVIVAEWHIEQGGAVTRLLIPPSAVQAIRAPETFTKIEAFAAYKLQGAAKLLYAALADKKRMAQSHWTFGLDELRAILGAADKKAYERWNNLRARVLDPALAAINEFGTVTVTMTPEKVGRAIAAVRFDWHWKTIDEARETDEENERHGIARGKHQEDASAPPLVERSPKVQEILRKNGVIDPD